MIALNGKVPYFSLSSILRFLYSNKITGALILTRKNERMRIYLSRGKVVGAESDRKEHNSPIENLIDLAVWLDGEFRLEILPEDKLIRNITVPSDQITLLLVKKENAFKELKDDLPPLGSVLIMNPENKTEEIRLQPDEWNYLSKIDGKKTLEDLIFSLDMSELNIFNITVKLIQKGILKTRGAPETVQKVESPAGQKVKEEETVEKEVKKPKNQIGTAPLSPSPDKKLGNIEKVFAKYVGPMATIIMDEVVDSLDVEGGKTSKEALSTLVEKLCMELESEEERKAFEEEVFSLMKRDE